eukprot:COSAG01_NODE_15717_length_1306_cov_21.748136_1_plen_50_part_10
MPMRMPIPVSWPRYQRAVGKAVDGEQSIQVTNTKMMDKKVFYEVTWRDKR